MKAIEAILGVAVVVGWYHNKLGSRVLGFLRTILDRESDMEINNSILTRNTYLPRFRLHSTRKIQGSLNMLFSVVATEISNL